MTGQDCADVNKSATARPCLFLTSSVLCESRPGCSIAAHHVALSSAARSGSILEVLLATPCREHNLEACRSLNFSKGQVGPGAPNRCVDPCWLFPSPGSADDSCFSVARMFVSSLPVSELRSRAAAGLSSAHPVKIPWREPWPLRFSYDMCVAPGRQCPRGCPLHSGQRPTRNVEHIASCSAAR